MRRFYWTALLLAAMLVPGSSTAQVTIDPMPPTPPPGSVPSGSSPEATADPEAAEPELYQNFQPHLEKSPHQLWVELQALHSELQLNAEEYNYDVLPGLGREFGARLWALLAVTHDDLPIENQVMAKRTTAVGGELAGRWARAAALHWPDSLHDPILFTNSLMRSIERAYPPELLNPPAAETSEVTASEDAPAKVGAPAPEPTEPTAGGTSSTNTD